MNGMRIGSALFLIALGAILKWAVTGHVRGIDLHAVGVILMVIGIIGLVLELFLWTNRRRTTIVDHPPQTLYVDHPDPVDRY
jgi:hypothetical protein